MESMKLDQPVTVDELMDACIKAFGEDTQCLFWCMLPV